MRQVEVSTEGGGTATRPTTVVAGRTRRELVDAGDVSVLRGSR
jgi:hypothetical protein